jgi:hypothetical protein
VAGLGDHHLSRFFCLPKIVCATQKRVNEICNLHNKPQSVIEKYRRGFLQFNKKLDVNSLFTFAVHFPSEGKNTPIFEDA